MREPLISIILATDLKLGIGKDGKLPWHIPEDMKWFRTMTKDKIVIMGWKTWESLAFQPLKGRLNVIVTSRKETPQEEWLTAITIFVKSIADALAVTKMNGHPEAVFIGGAVLWESLFADYVVDRMYITEVQGEYDCDTFFDYVGRGTKLTKFQYVAKTDRCTFAIVTDPDKFDRFPSIQY
jgi:dihydrofolate reductase